MTIAMLLAILLLAGVFLFFGWYCSALRPRAGTLDWVALQDRPALTFAVPRHKLAGKDALPILLLTAAYALSAFFSLGSPTAPDYRRALDLSAGQSYTIEVIGEPVYISKIWSYSTLGTGGYNLEVSKDGKTWSTLWTRTEQDQWGRDQTVYYWALAGGFEPSYALPQTYNHVFKWTETVPENPQLTRYIRITGRPDPGQVLRLGKLLFLDQNGQSAAYTWRLRETSSGSQEAPAELAYVLAPDSSVPQRISWRNSAYFDEIYHPRTALEHIEGLSPYETTHPPLGKLIIGLGVRLFGMTGLGWRFMGALFGVGMVPLMYLFIKNIFGKTNLAVCGTALFATEFMHLTQTRIATIDTYGVFFILLSYLFFYRWLTATATPDKRGAVHEGWLQLALSGLFFGVGVACKWTVLYAGVGLGVLYLLHMVLRIRSWDHSETAPRMAPWLWKTLGLSVLFFVLVPGVIYTLSYLPYAQAAGDATLSGLIRVMWDNQRAMLSYHNQVHDYHPYASRWYQWLVDARPILYYAKDLGNGFSEKFASFLNPLVAWGGLLAILSCMVRCFRSLRAKLALVGVTGLCCALACWLAGRVPNGDFDPALDPQRLKNHLVWLAAGLVLYLAAATLIALQTEHRSSGLDIFLTVGYAAQLLPWVFIDRVTFAYHYFPATLFLILALCRVFDDLTETPWLKWRGPVYGFTAASAGLYLLFYPALTGLAMPALYFSDLIRFLPSWPF